MCTIDRADQVNTALLRSIYPGLVIALKGSGIDAVPQLQAIARGEEVAA
jgi:hypothetical protein